MASIFEKKDRRVIPNLRSLKKSAQYGDFQYFRKDKNISDLNDIHFGSLKEQWNKSKTIGHAADLVSSGFVVDPNDNKVKDAANFVLNSQQASQSLVSISKRILANEVIDNNEPDLLNLFINQNTLSNLYARIHLIKKQIINLPINPLNYVELSRLYLLLGQKDKAMGSMKKSLLLDPNNRFVLRSAVRLFAHFGEFDFPHHYLLNSNFLLLDPWILSTEIALSSIKGKRSKFIKKGQQLISSNNYSPFSLTELCASIGTVDLLDGSLKKAKKEFRRSLECPNDNSLAQVEWASTEKSLFDINPNDFTNVKSKSEALTLEYFHNEEWVETIKCAEKWFIDSPFSKRPLLFGFHVCSSFLDDQNKAADFCKAGLTSNPRDPKLINNTAYSLLLLNKVHEAEDFLNQINLNSVENEVTRICLKATFGLLNFRKGNHEQGRKLYLEAIDETTRKSNSDLKYIAILNYAREEIRLNSEYVDGLMSIVSKIPERVNKKEINILKSKIINQYKNRMPKS